MQKIAKICAILIIVFLIGSIVFVKHRQPVKMVAYTKAEVIYKACAVGPIVLFYKADSIEYTIDMSSVILIRKNEADGSLYVHHIIAGREMAFILPIQYKASFSDIYAKYLSCNTYSPYKSLRGNKFKITAYIPKDTQEGRSSGLTASGSKAIPYQSAAVDPDFIKLGEWLLIKGLGWFKAVDTGNLVSGRHIDICVANKKWAIEWGIRHKEVIRF